MAARDRTLGGDDASKPSLRQLAIIPLFVVLFVVAMLFTPLGETPLSNLFDVGEVEDIDFATLTLHDRPNQFLMCPAGLCDGASHARSPVFEVPVERLRAVWQAVAAAEPRTERLAQGRDRWQVDYVQRSARFRFPDLITVRFIAVAPSRSTLAVYSRSVYGHSDLGVNRDRIEAWLERVRARL